ncbi:MAG: 3-deoxy-manno-octulosonate cytidylyltransferase [Synergistaceae bacterium]|jgi:3-deoxy-manno-octulosonate cytidylyltransferase (CMP-KDO synthetase)|nr:3-deoxy-manno-octulosonate cytidylyltransferase [Synergistaceae bacterium]
MKILGVIPARYASTRLPGKVLADICGKPMIRLVYERAARASCLDELVVATDDEKVREAVKAFGGHVVLTDPTHPNGTSRSAELAKLREVDCVINIQGDEPLLDPEMIEEVARTLTSSPDIVSATLCRPITGDAPLADPNVVKVVCDRMGCALYFSRSLIPFPREGFQVPVYEHVGIYGYTKDFLLKYVQLPMTPLAETESLEQLKILENGYKMKVSVTRCPQIGPNVNTYADLEAVRKILSQPDRG